MSKPFSVEYTNAAGLRVKERPRLMITVDGKHKSLFIGDNVLATVPIDTNDAEMWSQARAKINTIQY